MNIPLKYFQHVRKFPLTEKVYKLRPSVPSYFLVNKYCHRFPPILFTDQTIEMRDNTASSSARSFFSPAPQSQPRALLHMSRRKIKSSRDPWSKIVSDWFQQKTIKEFLIGPFKFAQERLNIRCVWCVSGFFPCNV